MSGIENVYAEEGNNTISYWKFVVWQYRKTSLQNPCVSQNFWYRKFIWVGEGEAREGVSRFSVKKFLSHSAEKFRSGESFSVSLFSGIEKVWMTGWGGCQDFPSKNSCLTVPKNFVGHPFRVSLISGIEKFYASEGYVTIFCRIFFSQCRKIS